MNTHTHKRSLKTKFQLWFRFSILTIGISSILFSCQEDSIFSNSSSENQLLTQAADHLSVFPTDFLGIIHNEFLDEVAKDVDFPSTKNSKRFEIIKNHATAYGIDVSNVSSFQNIRSNDSNFNEEDIDFKALVNQLFEEGTITKEALDYLLDLEEIIANNFWSSDVGLQLETLKADVLANPILSNVEQNMLVGLIIIERYSAEYWERALKTTGNPWHGLLPVDPSPSQLPVLRDGWGYIKGFVGSSGGIRSRHAHGVIVAGLYSAAKSVD